MQQLPSATRHLAPLGLLSAVLGLPGSAWAMDCVCESRAPLEVALASATDVVVATVQSGSTSRSISMQSLGKGRSRRTTTQTTSWSLTVGEALLGELQADRTLQAHYAELSCSEIMGPGVGEIVPERRAGQAGTCLGSGREVIAPSGARLGRRGTADDGVTGTEVIALIARSEQGFRLLRVAPLHEEDALQAALRGRSAARPASGLAAVPDRVHLPGLDPRLSTLAWLPGAWVGLEDNGQVEEHWTQAAGGTMLGIHREVQGDQTRFTERIAVGVSEDGERLFYEAQPSSAEAPTRFEEAERGPHHVVFANPEHDWPTHIRYSLLETGYLELQAYGGEKVATWLLAPATVTASEEP